MECNYKKDSFEVRNEVHVVCEFENVTYDATEIIHNITGDRLMLLRAVGINPELDYVEEDRVDDFVTKIKFKSSQIAKIPNLVFQKFEKLKLFDGSNVGLKNLTTLSFNGAANLVILFLHNNQLTKIIDHVFVHTKKLKVLDLANNKIAHIGIQAFNSLAKVEELSLSNNRLSFIDEAILKPMTQLRWLWLDRNHFKVIPINLFTKTSENLHGIYLNDNTIEKISPFSFDNLRKLRFLMLKGNQCIDMDFKNHFIQNNTSIRLEMNACFETYRKDKKLAKEVKKFNTKMMDELERSTNSCVNETKHIELTIVELLAQVHNQILKLTRTQGADE